MFDMKLSIYEFLYVIFSSSVTDCCFSSSAGTFHPLFIVRRFCHHWILHKSYKKGGLLKSICMFKVSNIYIYVLYIYIYIHRYIYIYTYIYILYIWVTPNTNQAFPCEGRIVRNPSTSYKLSSSHQENPPGRLIPHQSCIHPRVFLLRRRGGVPLL